MNDRIALDTDELREQFRTGKMPRTTWEDSKPDPHTPDGAEREAERKRCLAIAFEVLQHGPGFDCSKEFADGYSLAAQEIAAAIQRSK